MGSEIFFETKELTKYFGGLAAVNGLDFTIDEGEIIGLIGPNGAGKTTVFNMVSGIFRPTRGQVIFHGEDITHLKPHEIVKRGLCRTFQLTTIFNNCSVLENVLVGYHLHTRMGFWGALFRTRAIQGEDRKVRKKGEEILEFMGLGHLKKELAKNLPHGQKRVLGISIALATDPKLLLLDEPMTGMNPEETRRLMELISRISESGVTILLVEHDMKAVMGLCRRIVVLNYGKKISEGSPEEIRQNKDVIEAYLGAEEYATA